jgi:hypothetical protein
MEKNQPEARQGLGRVRFLARLDPIREAVARGYPLQVIYDEQRVGLRISYSHFARYVRQFVYAADVPAPNRRSKGKVGARGGDLVPPAKGGATSVPPGFRYRPTPGDDDLV